MASECHSVVRAPAMRVTRLDECGVPVESACSSAVTNGFVEIALTKVFQERQDALQLNANGDICVDKPKAPILRWYEANVQFCSVNPELFNIMTAEPLVLNDAVSPVAIGWDTEIGSDDLSNFALEFWVGTEDEGCDDGEVTFGYGILPWMFQANLMDITVGNAVITFTVNAITKKGSPWGVGPYNVLINETGPDAGLPGPMLTPIGPNTVKRFFWTRLAPPESFCGCIDATPLLANSPAGGTAPEPITFTIPTDADGNFLVPGILDFGNADPNEAVTTGTPVVHNYTVPGSFTATYRLTEESGPTWTSAAIVIT